MPLRHTSRHLIGLLATGALAALPLAATFAIFWWAAGMLTNWLGPGSAIGRAMVALGLGVGGSELVGYLIGIGLVLVALVLLGALVRTGVQQGASRLLDGALRRIPLVRTVYDLATRLVDLLRQGDREGPKSAVLALLSSVEPVVLEGRPHLAVIVPTAPVPVGGGLLFVPAGWVRAAEVGMEALTDARVFLKAALVDASPKMGDIDGDEGHRQEQPEEVLGAPGLRRCERASSQLVRRGDQGDLAQSAGHQGPVRQREHLRQ